MKKLEGLANFSRKPPPLPIFCCVHVWLAKNAANCNKRLALCCVQGFTTTLLYFLLCATFEVTPKKWRKLIKKGQQLTHQNYAASMQHSFVIHTKRVFYLTLPLTLLISLIDMLLLSLFFFCNGNFTACA